MKYSKYIKYVSLLVCWYKLYKSQTLQTSLICPMTCFLLCPMSSLNNFYKSLTYSNKSLTSLSSHNIYSIKSITLPSFFPFSTLKTFYISKLSTRGVVFSISIWWLSLLIIPKAFFSFFIMHYNHIITTILLLNEIMFLCSRCDKKGLVYIVIALPTGC